MANTIFSPSDEAKFTEFFHIVKATCSEIEPSGSTLTIALKTGSLMFLIGMRLQKQYPEIAAKWMNALERFGSNDEASPEEMEVTIRRVVDSMINA